MVPPDFANFFLATAGAGGALIGLLFVAISINPERTFSADAPKERQVVASGAFTALVNAFFISTAALIPGINLGDITVAMSVLGLLNTVRVGVDMTRYQVRQPRHGRGDFAVRLARAAFVTALSLVLYGLQLTNAVDLVQHPHTLGDVYAICSLILAIYGVGLTRAWELLGAPRVGMLAFLNPLAGLDEPRSPDAAAPATFTTLATPPAVAVPAVPAPTAPAAASTQPNSATSNAKDAR
jgi:hypothetical protein